MGSLHIILTVQKAMMSNCIDGENSKTRLKFSSAVALRIISLLFERSRTSPCGIAGHGYLRLKSKNKMVAMRKIYGMNTMTGARIATPFNFAYYVPSATLPTRSLSGCSLLANCRLRKRKCSITCLTQKLYALPDCVICGENI